VLRVVTDEWVCPACGATVIDNVVAEARGLLPWSKWRPPANFERIPGFWTADGVSYERIATPTPDRTPYIRERPALRVPWRLLALLGAAFGLGMCL